jgi:Holliday junction resolvase RusA-like endonuclease
MNHDTKHISLKIKGIPYGGNRKRRGDQNTPEKWSMSIKEQTKTLPKISNACIMKVTFLLPHDKFPLDFPYGPDLDNLLKRFLDALNETVFSEAKGKDSCVISMNVTKTKVKSVDEAGVLLEILPIIV